MAVTVAILRILVECLRMSLQGTPVEGWVEYLVGEPESSRGAVEKSVGKRARRILGRSSIAEESNLAEIPANTFLLL
jgi:hypothetical protein